MCWVGRTATNPVVRAASATRGMSALVTIFLPVSPVAEAAGAPPDPVVVSAAPTKAASLAAFAAALQFPSYFGGNLDALLDCLRDRPAGGRALWWRGVALLRDADRDSYRGILRVLADWQAERADAEVYVSY